MGHPSARLHLNSSQLGSLAKVMEVGWWMSPGYRQHLQKGDIGGNVSDCIIHMLCLFLDILILDIKY